ARVSFGIKTLYIHYDGKWPNAQPIGGFSYMDYMNGKELRWPKFDGDYLNLKDLLDSVHDCIEHLDGAQCLFHYLEDGFLYDIDEEKDLLKFWEESDQDVPNEVHFFMTYDKAMNVLKPGQPLVPPVVDEVVVDDEVVKTLGLAPAIVDDEVV
ncbi:hypothetical protein MKW92_015358, partial [Papaver armeniacum]